MKTKKNLSIFLSALISTSMVQAKPKRKPDSLDRPPQFVMLAFDGSKDLSFWDESFDFANTVATTDKDNQPTKMRFTYFVNPTYYLAKENKSKYNTPELGPGHSCIGWSNSVNDISPRIARTNRAFENGHEIGSHANAHCDQSGVDRNDPMFGHPWDEAAWSSEFDQFNYLLFNSYSINKVKPAPGTKSSSGFSFAKNDIVGFRAPKLAYTPGLWPTLKKNDFRYDTSRSSAPDYWPQRQSWGGWNFPLAEIKIAGTTRKVLTMDYNWLYFHSAGASKPGLTDADRARMYNQVMDSYKYYFKKNYFGNRAPIHIGHHFSQWNKGVYWSVMKDFAKFVCNKPEVHCVTYKEYADYLDALPAAKLAAYRVGNFERMPDDKTIKDIATPVLADIRLDSNNEKFEAIVADADRAKVNVLGWKPQLQVNFEAQPTAQITREQLAEKYKGLSNVVIRAALVNKSGVEMNWQTYRIDNVGTPKESVQGPLEDNLLKGEGADAHEE